MLPDPAAAAELGPDKGTSVDDTTETTSLGNREQPLSLITDGESCEAIRTSFWINFAPVLSCAMAVVGCVELSPWLSGNNTATSTCEDPALMSAAERGFQINIQVFESLSFAQAKIVDLAWDIGVAHGGRLLHGWLLYHMAGKAITWSLERSAIPYTLLVDVLFWPDSLSSLWSTLSYLAGRKRSGVLIVVVPLAYCITHVLFFGTVWSAATGYQSPGVLAFSMSDGSWVIPNNESLRICWSIESPQRAGGHLPADGIVVGPKFGDYFRSFYDFGSPDGTTRVWDTYQNLGEDGSEDFFNIYSCKSRPCRVRPSAKRNLFFRCTIKEYDAHFLARIRLQGFKWDNDWSSNLGSKREQPQLE